MVMSPVMKSGGDSEVEAAKVFVNEASFIPDDTPHYDEESNLSVI